MSIHTAPREVLPPDWLIKPSYPQPPSTLVGGAATGVASCMAIGWPEEDGSRSCDLGQLQIDLIQEGHDLASVVWALAHLLELDFIKCEGNIIYSTPGLWTSWENGDLHRVCELVVAQRVADRSPQAARGASDRNIYFSDLYEGRDPTFNHHPAVIRDHWNSLSDARRREIGGAFCRKVGEKKAGTDTVLRGCAQVRKDRNMNPRERET